MTLIHKTKGLSRPCNSSDLFLVSEGLQCGNCLAYTDEHLTQDERTAKHKTWQEGLSK
jgi:hypothetical protein